MYFLAYIDKYYFLFKLILINTKVPFLYKKNHSNCSIWMQMLEEQPASSSVGRAKFIVFVTDITRFSSDMPELSKYPVHAYGLGASHDAAALRLIAQRSQGTYSFLDDANADKDAAALALCLGGLKSVAAVGARVVLKAASGSGVRIDRISSGGYASSVSHVDRASGEIAIGALYAGEVKSFVVHLDVPAAPETSPGGRLLRPAAAARRQPRRPALH
jgi:hypothetical protein